MATETPNREISAAAGRGASAVERLVIRDILERTKAADQLGYSVEVTARGDSLEFCYVKRPAKLPFVVR